MNKDKILRGQPFRNIIGKIIDVKPTPHGHSSTTFIIVGSSGKRYKLRYFRGLRKAIQIEKNVRKLPHVFPEFYGREERFLLFEWIDGDIVGKRMPPDDAYQIGKIVGEAHELEEIDHVNYFRNFIFIFYRDFQKLKEYAIFDEKILARIELKFSKLRKKMKVDIALEVNDIHGGNFMRDKKGRIYFIDEEGFSHRPKGEGLSKALNTLNFMKDGQNRAAFLKGYNEHHSDDYFDLDYQRLMAFLGMLKSIWVKHKIGIDYTNHKEAVLQMIKKI